MKATMNLDDQLYRRVKIRAAEEGTTVTSLVELALERLLSQAPAAGPAPRFRVPVLPSAGGLLPDVDLISNSRLHDLLDADLPTERLR